MFSRHKTTQFLIRITPKTAKYVPCTWFCHKSKYTSSRCEIGDSVETHTWYLWCPVVVNVYFPSNICVKGGVPSAHVGAGRLNSSEIVFKARGFPCNMCPFAACTSLESFLKARGSLYTRVGVLNVYCFLEIISQREMLLLPV